MKLLTKYRSKKDKIFLHNKPCNVTESQARGILEGTFCILSIKHAPTLLYFDNWLDIPEGTSLCLSITGSKKAP